MMEPGRELDALIAEKVLGWDRKHAVVECEDEWYSYCKNCGLTGAEVLPAGSKRTWDTPCDTPPGYSTDIAAAWEVVERMRLAVMPREGEGYWAGVIAYDYKDPCGVIDQLFGGVFGSTAPHAICLAALKALGITPPGLKP
jgi:Phage ABA sandwich domain